MKAWRLKAIWALAVSLALLDSHAGWSSELTGGELRREDSVRVEVIGRGRFSGRLLGVERDIVLLGIGHKVEPIPMANIMRVWRDDGRIDRTGRTVLGVVAGLVAGGVVAALLSNGDDYYTYDRTPAGGKPAALTGGAAVGAAVFLAVAYGVSSGTQRWTEVAVSELRTLDTLPTVQELVVEPEEPSTPEPTAPAERPNSEGRAVTSEPQAAPPTRGMEPDAQ